MRLWRGEEAELIAGSGPRMTETFGDDGYKDVPGLCKAASRAEIAAQDWSLNPGRYVGVAPGAAVDDEDFRVRLEALHEELETLNAEAARLQAVIAQNVAEVLSCWLGARLLGDLSLGFTMAKRCGATPRRKGYTPSMRQAVLLDGQIVTSVLAHPSSLVERVISGAITPQLQPL